MDGMQSTDSNKYGRHPKEFISKIDKEILSLFPSLDFNRQDIDVQKSKGMITRLRILDNATEKSVTKYSLTQWKAEPRFGGQPAQDALIALSKLGLIKAEKTISPKRTIRNDYFLTPKGIVACLCFSNIQQKITLSDLLKQTKFKGNKLVFVLTLFNETFVRVEKAPEGLSPVILLLERMAKKGFDFERKNEEEIADDLRKTEQEIFFESLRIDAFGSYELLLSGLSQFDKKTKKVFMSTFQNSIKQLSNSKLNPEQKEQAMELTKRHVKNMANFITSQEYMFFIQKGWKNPTLEDIAQLVVKQDVIDDKVLFIVDFWLKMQLALFERLFKDFCQT